jgi:transposase
MRQVHVAGDKLFIDYAGMKPCIVDATTGEVIEVELFVAVLGASNYTFAEATRTQSVSDFVGSVSRTLTFLGGAPRAIVPDQLKSAIVKACRYDPGVQRTTAELARYYETTTQAEGGVRHERLNTDASALTLRELPDKRNRNDPPRPQEKRRFAPIAMPRTE